MNVIEVRDMLIHELRLNDKIKGIGQTGDLNANHT